jgi:hypothetical protein
MCPGTATKEFQLAGNKVLILPRLLTPDSRPYEAVFLCDGEPALVPAAHLSLNGVTLDEVDEFEPEAVTEFFKLSESSGS